MSDQKFPTIQHAIIKVVGIFDYDKKFQQNLESSLGYTVVPVIDFKNAQFYRDKYYKEFNELMLTRTAKNATKTYEKSLSSKILFKKFETIEKSGVIEKREKEIGAEISHLELKLFENNIGIFAMSVIVDSLNFQEISDLTYCLRFFSTQVEGENIPLHKWISKHVLGGKSLRTSEENKVDSDEYSGSKFKLYSVFSINEQNLSSNYNRDHLLYEIGTGSMLGCVKSNSYLTPSIEYYSELTEFRVSAFQSWTGLALLDSYTAIGSNLITNPDGSVNGDAFVTQDRIYFSIYLFNLYIKYNVFRFNSKFKEDAVKYKGRFEDFINDYNYSHISFDFLPNLIYSKMRAALGIENEIKQFEKRLNSLAANIQEEQEKRQAALLGIISVISSISAIEPIFETSEQVREYTGMESNLFYALLSIVVIAIAIPILSYLFPHIAKKVWKKLNLYFKND